MTQHPRKPDHDAHLVETPDVVVDVGAGMKLRVDRKVMRACLPWAKPYPRYSRWRTYQASQPALTKFKAVRPLTYAILSDAGMRQTVNAWSATWLAQHPKVTCAGLSQ
jgi:hypothetical protein